MTEKGMFSEEALIKELIARMEMDESVDFNPFIRPQDDYKVLQWMRTTVKGEYITTYRTFISYISGAMYQYVVGDFVRCAILAIGIISAEQETGNE